MIAFTSFPVQPDYNADYGESRHHSNIEQDVIMDLDNDDFEAGAAKLTHPGEPLTSAQAYMR